MEFLTHSYIALLGSLPSILLLFGVYLLWEQSRLMNRQLHGIAQLLSAVHDEQRRADAAHRLLDENRPGAT